MNKYLKSFLYRFGPAESVQVLLAMRNRDTNERFFSLISVDKQNECWIWRGAVDNKGYGTFIIDEEYKHTHLVAWVATMGLIGGGLCLRHTCGNRLCCNPDHMFLDTKEGVV